MWINNYDPPRRGPVKLVFVRRDGYNNRYQMTTSLADAYIICKAWELGLFGTHSDKRVFSTGAANEKDAKLQSIFLHGKKISKKELYKYYESIMVLEITDAWICESVGLKPEY